MDNQMPEVNPINPAANTADAASNAQSQTVPNAPVLQTKTTSPGDLAVSAPAETSSLSTPQTEANPLGFSLLQTNPAKTLKLWIGVFVGVIVIGGVLAFMGRSALFKGSFGNDDYATLCTKNGQLEQDGRCLFHRAKDYRVDANDLPALQAEIKSLFKSDCGVGWNEIDVTCAFNNKVFDNLNDYYKEADAVAALLLSCVNADEKFINNDDGKGYRCVYNGKDFFTIQDVQGEQTLVTELKKTCTDNHGTIQPDPLVADQKTLCNFDKNTYDTSDSLEKAVTNAQEQLTDICTGEFAKASGLKFIDGQYCFRIEDDGTESTHFFAANVTDLIQVIDAYTAPVKKLCESDTVLVANDATWVGAEKGCSIPVNPSHLYFTEAALKTVSQELADQLKDTCSNDPTAQKLGATFANGACTVPLSTGSPYTSYSKLKGIIDTEHANVQKICTTDPTAVAKNAEWDVKENRCFFLLNPYYTAADLNAAIQANVQNEPQQVPKQIGKMGITSNDDPNVPKQVQPTIEIQNISASLKDACTQINGVYAGQVTNETCTFEGHVLTNTDQFILLGLCSKGGYTIVEGPPLACQYNGKDYTTSDDLLVALGLKKVAPQSEVPKVTVSEPVHQKAPVQITNTITPEKTTIIVDPFQKACTDNEGTFANAMCTIKDVGVFTSEASLTAGLAAYNTCAQNQDIWDTDAKKCIPYSEISGQGDAQVADLQKQIADLQNQLANSQSVTSNQNSAEIDALKVQIANLSTQLNEDKKTGTTKTGSTIVLNTTKSGTTTTKTAMVNTGSGTADASTGDASSASAAAGSVNTGTASSDTGNSSMRGAADASASASASAGSAQDLKYHGSYIRGKTGPEILLYPLAVISGNGVLMFYRRRKRNKK